jgi:hypothetical protein
MLRDELVGRDVVVVEPSGIWPQSLKLSVRDIVLEGPALVKRSKKASPQPEQQSFPVYLRVVSERLGVSGLIPNWRVLAA